jgi:ribosome biogenesis SPOUT family RNA methylase Rps3
MAVYIIEHLEPRIWKWCLIEYKHISEIVGKENLWFTNLKNGSKTLSCYGKVIRHSVKEINLKNACVLDPKASNLLEPKEAKTFDYFIFGGILGDYPPRKRTKSELTQFIKNVEARNIGKEQFSTDNAVYVTKQIREGKNLKDMKFKNKLTIKINDIESVDLPYCYPIVNKKPLMSEEIIKYLKKKKGF